MRITKLFWIIALLLVLALAACGEDQEPASTNSNRPATSEATESTGGFNPSGPDLEVSAGETGQLPGCSDPSSTECPAPLTLPLDRTIEVDGVTISYPSEYFVVEESDENTEGVPIRLVPADNYPFEEKAVFQMYFTETADQALSELDDLGGEQDAADWTTAGGLSGKIGVAKDQEKDPPVNTTIGAFVLDDGRVFVLKLETTGKFGWDLYTAVYEGMIDSITPGAPPATEAAPQ